jgi:2-oxo-3-hexenedioate decarboxylase
MSEARHRNIAQTLFDAYEDGLQIQASSLDVPPTDIDDAYAIQAALCELHEAAGRTRIGVKAGVTNKKTLASLGGQDPLSGVLFDSFLAEDGSTVDASNMLGPKVESEIAFAIDRELKGPGCHAGDVLRATEFVVPAIEIVDSRLVADELSLKNIAADNVAASCFVLGGRPVDVTTFDLRTTGAVVEVNGEQVALGAGAAVWNHPVESVARLANTLGRRGESIPAGSIVLSGSFTAPTPIGRNAAVHVRFQHFGSVTVRLKENG